MKKPRVSNVGKLWITKMIMENVGISWNEKVGSSVNPEYLKSCPALDKVQNHSSMY